MYTDPTGYTEVTNKDDEDASPFNDFGPVYTGTGNIGYSGGGHGYTSYYDSSAYNTYSVRTTTAYSDGALGGYHTSAPTHSMVNPSYYNVPGAVTVTDDMATTNSHCFVEGTLVATENGLVPIENIQPGDFVWATDPETEETELKQVVQLFRNETNEWIHVTVNGETITCTPEHPFYSPVKGWINAIDLRAGDILVMLHGEYVVIEQVQHELLESPEITYNFEVEGYHTYFVGNIKVLVHNMCKKNGLVEGKPEIPKGATKIRSDTRNVKSQEFKDFIRSTGQPFRSSEWKYKMETWETAAGKRIERHYWYNRFTGNSYYHQ